jgi:molecular chaperone GrpE
MTDSVPNTDEFEPIEDIEQTSDEAPHEMPEDDVIDATGAEDEAVTADDGTHAADGDATTTGDAQDGDTEDVAAEGDFDAEDADGPDEGDGGADGPEDSNGGDDGFGAAAGDDEIAESESELDVLQGDYHALNDRHLRLAAEFNNFRRRTEQERLTAWARAQADLLGRFLDVLDDLHRVAELDLSNATVEAIMEGIDLVEKKFVRELTDAGAEMQDPLGEAFDPETMEAMMRVPTDDEEQDDTVAGVFQKGYSLKGILVRHARVSVHKHG